MGVDDARANITMKVICAPAAQVAFPGFMSPMAHANARHSEVGALVDTNFGGSDAILRVEGSPSARTRLRSRHAGLPQLSDFTD